jgi:DNA repair protein RadD
VSYELRYYQEDAVVRAWNALHTTNENTLIALPTGTGKSVVIAALARMLLTHYAGLRILVLAHRKELIDQNADKLRSLMHESAVGVFSAGLKSRQVDRPVTFAGIASVAAHIEHFKDVSVVIIDEAHLVSDKETTTYAKTLDKLTVLNPNLRVLGLTATPYRSGLGILTNGGIFDSICCDWTSRDRFNQLLQDGFLARLVPRQTHTAVTGDGAKVRGGDFMEADLQKAVDLDDLNEAAIDEIVASAVDREHGLIFATGVEHAEHLCDALIRRNESATVVHGGLSNDERDRRINAFKQGEYRFAVNNNILTTGFDFPGIDLIGMLRPTLSTALWVQMLGRGTRPFPGKRDCLVLDFARNTMRLGPINDPVLPKRKQDKDEKGEKPVKICPYCGAYNSTRAALCSSCGNIFPPPDSKLSATASTMALIAGAPEEPLILTIPVDVVNYRIHTKQGSSPSLKVEYLCGLSRYTEYVCIEHQGLAHKKAINWWAKRTQIPLPTTVSEAILLVRGLPAPKTIDVWVNKKYPEVMAHGFA